MGGCRAQLRQPSARALHIIHLYMHIDVYAYKWMRVYIYIYIYLYAYMYMYIHIYIYIYTHIYINYTLCICICMYMYMYMYAARPDFVRAEVLPRPLDQRSEKGEVLLRGVGTLRSSFPPNASVQWQPDGWKIDANKWFLGAGFLRAPPISLQRAIFSDGCACRKETVLSPSLFRRAEQAAPR